jgi:hypothetical protein
LSNCLNFNKNKCYSQPTFSTPLELAPRVDISSVIEKVRKEDLKII